MSIAEKAERVAEAKETFGLNCSLKVVGLAKSTWYSHCERQTYEEKYAHLQDELEMIACEHPEYGYRRTTTALQEKGYEINQKVVRRLHQSWRLALLRSTKAPKPSRLRKIIRRAGERANLVAGLKDIGLFEVFYTDFTELFYADGTTKAYLMPILDHASRLCLGWALAEHPNRDLALAAWRQAKQQLDSWQIQTAGCILHQDQDSVYTSYAWTGQFLLKEKMRLSFALAGAKDNPFVESFFSRFKEEGRSEFLDARSLSELQAVVARRIGYYNANRYHSSLDNRAPIRFIQQEFPGRIPLHI